MCKFFEKNLYKFYFHIYIEYQCVTHSKILFKIGIFGQNNQADLI
jgi:hypothetical protein